MRRRGLAGVAAIAAWLVLAATGVSAQTGRAPKFLDRHPTIAEALDGAYGLAIAGSLATLLAETADLSCSASRKLDAAAWHATSRRLLTVTHDALSDVLWRARDGAKADAAFARHGGSRTELEALAFEPALSAVVAAQREVAKTGIISTAIERFGQFAILIGYRRLTDANPLVTGDDRLLQLSEAADVALDTALAAAPPDLVARLTKQSEAIEKALDESVVDQDVLLQWGPLKLAPALAPLLEAVCVTSGR